jgi:uncharacterized protein (DUF736 family)
MIFTMDASSSSLEPRQSRRDMRSIPPLRKMVGNVDAWAQQHQSNKPYPHVDLDHFFDPNLIADLVRDYPGVSNLAWKGVWVDPQHEEENRPARDINSDLTPSNRRTPQS